jgi:hypothetical protein
MTKYVIRCRDRYLAHEKPLPGAKSVDSIEEAFKFETEHRARVRLASTEKLWRDEAVIEPVEVPHHMPHFPIIALPLAAILLTPATDYTCEVFLRWRVDDQAGTSNVTLYIDDASSLTDAEGKAIYRAQASVRRNFPDQKGRRVTFLSTHVVCR